MAEPASTDNKRVHPLVVAFVVFHLVAITIYTLPKPHQGVLDGTLEPRGSDALLRYNQQTLKSNPVIAGYLFTTGFWQYWDMFAPDPAQTDIYVTTEVTYFDGSKKAYPYPRIYDLSIPKKFMYERHRKFYERVNEEKSAYLWPPFAQAIAVRAATDAKNPPVMVELTRHWLDLPRHDAVRGPKRPYGSYLYYRHVVNQAELAKAKGWQFGQR